MSDLAIRFLVGGLVVSLFAMLSDALRPMVEFKLSDIKETKPIELGVRFLFGSICTVGAGLIAKRYGVGIGGLFLAFPAILPASATLIQAHEKEKKAQIGSDGTRRGRMSASIDAADGKWHRIEFGAKFVELRW
jgi:hypothetical protein